MWIYRTGKSYTDTPIILYEYQRTRKADHPEEFLKDFRGIVVCDGYSAYRKLIDSLDGANASAIIYSITETAKANNLNPLRYLEYVLTVLKDHQEDKEYSFIDGILPWSEKLPEICRSRTNTTNI